MIFKCPNCFKSYSIPTPPSAVRIGPRQMGWVLSCSSCNYVWNNPLPLRYRFYYFFHGLLFERKSIRGRVSFLPFVYSVTLLTICCVMWFFLINDWRPFGEKDSDIIVQTPRWKIDGDKVTVTTELINPGKNRIQLQFIRLTAWGMCEKDAILIPLKEGGAVDIMEGDKTQCTLYSWDFELRDGGLLPPGGRTSVKALYSHEASQKVKRITLEIP